MKRTFIILSLLLTTLCLQAQQGIRFETGDLQAALGKAQAENKLLFVDAFTDWCGPCKMMAAKVFTNDSVAAYYNATFVNYQLDMEKGEGPAFAKRHGVNAYPTLLFLRPDGSLHDKVVGARPASLFLQLGRQMATPGRQTLTDLRKRFDAGDRDPAFLRQIIRANYEAGNAVDTTFYAYKPFMQGDALLQRENFQIYLIARDYYAQSEVRHVYAHREQFYAAFGKDTVNNHLGNTFFRSAYWLMEQKDWVRFDSVLQMIGSLDMEGAELAVVNLRTEECLSKQDLAGYQRYATIALEMKPSADAYNNFAYALANGVTDKKTLKTCLKWIDQSLALQESTYNLDSKAYILHKLGKKKDAIAIARKAIAKGKADGEDVTPTEEMLAEWLQEG